MYIYKTKNRAMKKIFIFFCILTVQITVNAQNQEVITSSFETGNVEKLAQFFDENVDLTVLTTEGIYSKAQSKVILKNFFSTNTPAKYTLQHQGGSENAKYVIGTLVSNENTYRIYFLFKKTNDKIVIQKIRIEND